MSCCDNTIRRVHTTGGRVRASEAHVSGNGGGGGPREKKSRESKESWVSSLFFFFFFQRQAVMKKSLSLSLCAFVAHCSSDSIRSRVRIVGKNEWKRERERKFSLVFSSSSPSPSSFSFSIIVPVITSWLRYRLIAKRSEPWMICQRLPSGILRLNEQRASESAFLHFNLACPCARVF